MLSKNLIKYIRSLEQKKNRKKEGVFVAEGPKVVGDLLKLYTPQLIVATEEWTRSHQACKCEMLTVTEDELAKTSFLQHPQQVIGLFPLPTHSAPSNPAGLSLALDGIQDPGNLGTIIRIADWFDISTIYCSLDTADAFSPKVVQATMGSIARVHLVYTDLTKLLDSLPKDTPVYGTLLDGKNIYKETIEPKGIIVMGNEGNGISHAIRQRITRRLLIPPFRQGDTADSLNVAIATAITCSEFRRRMG